jgi:hypothetical protein
LNLMENILSTYYECTLSAGTHKLNVSGHMLIRTFVLVLVCGTRAQSLSASFSYTLHKKAIVVVKKYTNRSTMPAFEGYDEDDEKTQ